MGGVIRFCCLDERGKPHPRPAPRWTSVAQTDEHVRFPTRSNHHGMPHPHRIVTQTVSISNLRLQNPAVTRCQDRRRLHLALCEAVSIGVFKFGAVEGDGLARLVSEFEVGIGGRSPRSISRGRDSSLGWGRRPRGSCHWRCQQREPRCCGENGLKRSESRRARADEGW